MTLHSVHARVQYDDFSFPQISFPRKTGIQFGRALLMAVSLLLTSRNGYAQVEPLGAGRPAAVSEKVRAQIAALTEEKMKRTPAQRKMDSQLIYATKAARGEPPARGVGMQNYGLQRSNADASRVQVEIKGKITKRLLQRISQLNGTVITSFPNFESVLAWMNLEQLEALSSHPDVRFVGLPPEIERDTGTVNSEGDKAHSADIARATFPIDASGLRIGVISDSASGAGIAASVASSELTPGQVTVLPGQDGGAGSDEGIAMMEIINDICPGAQLFFATSGFTQASFATNILDLRNTYACDIIVDDIRMNDELPFQDGPVARAVNTVASSGAIYFASAGNSGSRSNNTSGTWVGDFVDGGAITFPVEGASVSYRIHSFQTSPSVQNFNVVQAGGSSYSLGLFWADPEGASTNDYDVFQLSADGTAVISQSNNVQDGSIDPYERTSLSGSGGNRIIIVKRESAQNRALYLTTGRGRLSINTNGFARGHSAAPGAIATAAVPAAASDGPGSPVGPFPNAYTATQQLELFSSDGPARKFHNPDGSPVTPGNFLIGTGGGSSQLYPVLTAADGVSTSVPNFSAFFGTSAAAPHAAAMAGLLKAKKPSLTAAEIREILTSTALDIQIPGADNDSGFGIVRPMEALASIAEYPTVAITTPGHESIISKIAALSGIATDGGAGIAGNVVNVTLYQVSSSKYWTGDAWSITPTFLSIPVVDGIWAYSGTLPDNTTNNLAGQYTLSASTYDNLDNPSPAVSGVNNITFTVDTTPPEASIQSPEDGSTMTADSYVLSGTAEDASGIMQVNCFVRRHPDGYYWNGSGWGEPAINLVTSYDSSNDQWTCTDSLPQPGGELANGNYTFIAIAYDNSGHRTQVDSKVTVDFHQIYHWTAGSQSDADPYNNSFYWGNPANWSPNGVPDTEDIVVINLGDVVRSSISRTVYGFHLSLGALDFDDPGHSLTITKAGTWTSGTLEDAVFIQPAATFVISSGDIKQIGDGGVVHNYGSVTWSGPGQLRGYQNSTWNNKPGSSFTMLTDGDLFTNLYSGNIFNNEANAIFIKTAGDPGEVSTFIDDWTFNNHSKIECQQGTMHFDTTLNLNAGSNLAGAGCVILDGTTNLATVLPSTGHPELIGTLNGTIPNAGFTGSNPFIWSSGRINGRFDLAHGSVLELITESVKTLDDGAIFTNHGRVNWKAGQLEGYQNSTFNNEYGAVFDAFTDGDIFSKLYSGNVFNNAEGALFIKSGKSAVPGAVSYVDDWTFNNHGVIRSDDGLLHFHTTLNLNDGGSIARSGALPARVVSSLNFVLTGTTEVNNTTFETPGNWEGNLIEGSTGNGTISTTNDGVFEWSGGTVSHTVNIAEDSDFRISGNGEKSIGDGAVINHHGNATWSGEGPIRGYQNSTFRNLSGATFIAATDADFTYLYSGNTFVNAVGATFRKTAGSDLIICGWAFNNAGLVESSSGSLGLNNGGVSSGTYAPSTGGEIHFTGGQHDLLANANCTGTGIVRIIGGTIQAVNPVNSDFTQGLFAISGGTITSAPGGSFGVSGNIDWTGGTIAGVFNIATESDFSLDGGDVKWIGDGGVINNSGGATWNPPGLLRGYQNSTWNNKNGGSFTLNGDGDALANLYGGNVFNNEAGASFVKSAGGTGEVSSYIDEWTFNNNGAIDSRQGTLHFNTTLNLGIGSNFVGAGRVLLNGTTNLTTVLTSTSNPELIGILNGNNPTAGFSGSHPFVWSSGEINGAFSLQAASVMDLTTGNIKQIGDSSTFTNFGRVNWKAGLLRGYQNSAFNNESGAVFDAVTDGDVFSILYGGNVFNNKAGALFIKSGKTEAPDASTFIDEWTFNNGGSIRCDDGLLHFNTALHFAAGSSIARSGTLPARVLSSSYFVITGTTEISNITFESSGDWHGNLTPGSAGNGTISTISGGMFEWTGGTAHNTVNIAAGSNFVISGDTVKQIGDGGILNNQGIATRIGTGELRGYQNSAFVNQQGGVFNVMTSAPFTNLYGGNRLTNSGVMSIGSSPGTSPLHWSFTQTESGRLNLEIGGPDAAAPQFDQLHISGDANLAGKLGVTLINGYAPVAGTTFPVLTFGSRNGSVDLASSPGLIWGTQYNPNNITLVAKTYPTTLDEWTGYFFNDPDSIDAQSFGDPDKDGLVNLMEYTLGRNPHSGDGSGTTVGTVEIEEETYLTLTFTRPAGDAALTDVTYSGERSGSLSADGWASDGVVVHSTVPVIGEQKETVTLRSVHPVGDTDKEFLHLKVGVGP